MTAFLSPEIALLLKLDKRIDDIQGNYENVAKHQLINFCIFSAVSNLLIFLYIRDKQVRRNAHILLRTCLTCFSNINAIKND